jgi:hypothetical protein
LCQEADSGRHGECGSHDVRPAPVPFGERKVSSVTAMALIVVAAGYLGLLAGFAALRR